mgnify:CR=1 FL=1
MKTSIDSIMLILVVTNLLLLGFSQLRSSVRAVAIQGFALGLLPLMARPGGVAFWTAFLVLMTIGLKGVVFPRLMMTALRDSEVSREKRPQVGHSMSMLAGFLALAGAAWLSSRLPVFPGSPSTLAAPVSFFMIFVGLFIIVTRNHAVNQIVGYLVLENGIYVFGVVLLHELPLLVELGVLLDAFAAVFVMGVAVYHINSEFDHVEVDQLDMLKG